MISVFHKWVSKAGQVTGRYRVGVLQRLCAEREEGNPRIHWPVNTVAREYTLIM